MMDDIKRCENCRWFDDFTWCCYNGASEWRADFTAPGFVCEQWEACDQSTDCLMRGGDAVNG